MSLQAEDPPQVEVPRTNASMDACQGQLAVEAGGRGRVRNIYLALAVACAFILIASVVVDAPFYGLVGLVIPLALALARVLLVRTSRRHLAHPAETGLPGGVLEVTDVNGVRVRIPAGGGVSSSTNGFAIVSLITALVGLGGVLAVIFGHIARSQIRRTGERGWGMATAALIIGYIGIVAGIALAIVYFSPLSRF